MERVLTYLACPYGRSSSPNIHERRFQEANKAAVWIMKQGLTVFSPISHCHPMAKEGNLPNGWDYWEKFDRGYLLCSKEIYVLMIDGWEESTGVQAEIKIAIDMCIPIYYLTPSYEVK